MCIRICLVNFFSNQHHRSRTVQVPGCYISGQHFCVGICTGGAAAMTGRLSSLTTWTKDVAPESESMFETTTLPVFWIMFMTKHLEITTTALKSPLSFPTPHLCEVGFLQ
ncbi:hypothetical protein NPIL_597471 [Nephila pilipes]|uniref:Uncharacterized protein n=1 Tax=Nephila pilipes TaxID=299642 RepID=A0A8X6UE53_NEPPI|nr:hypothetical protein NPIL_597471 [Nephila pilipes]